MYLIRTAHVYLQALNLIQLSRMQCDNYSRKDPEVRDCLVKFRIHIKQMKRKLAAEAILRICPGKTGPDISNQI